MRDVHVSPNLVVFLPDDEADFAVRLQLLDAIDDVHAGILEACCPLDVAPFVESRFQFDEHGDLLAALGGLDEAIDDRRVRADAVERHLDGHDARIVDGRVDERFDRLKRVERVMHELIAIPDLVEDFRRAFAPDPGRLHRPIVQIRPRNGGERHPVGESHAASRPHDHLAVCLEVFDEQIQHAGRHAVFDFEQRDRAVPLFPEAAVDDLEDRFGGVLRVSDGHLHVAHDAKHVRGADADAGEELREVFANHVFEHRKAANPVVVGKRDKPRQEIGDLHARELRPSLVLDDHREVLAAVRDERKRMPRVEGEGRQNRADVDVEMPVRGGRGRHRCSRRRRRCECARPRAPGAASSATAARARRAWRWRRLSRASRPGRAAP